MKTFIKQILIVSVFLFSKQSSAVFFQWSKYYNGGSTDKGLNVVTDEATGIVYFSGTASLEEGAKIISSAYADDGTLLWQRTANTYLPGDIKQIERDDALNTFVLCTNYDGTFSLIRYNKNGVEKWRHNYSNMVTKFKLGGTGLFVCIITPTGVTIKRMNKSTGATVWSRSYADATLINNYGLSGFTIDINSNLYFCGTSNNSGPGTDDYKMIKVNKNGGLIYNIQYDTGGSNDEETYRITANDAGELFIVGDYANDIPSRTYYNLVKFNAAGVHQWHTYFESSVANVYLPMEVQISPDGSPVVVGNLRDFYNINPDGETVRIEVTKFNAVTGAVVFSVFPNDRNLNDQNLYEIGYCMTIDSHNNIYAGGASNISAGLDHVADRWMAVKVNGTTGNTAWVEAGVNENGLNNIADVTVTSSNEVYLASTENITGTPDMELVKYCQSGCVSARMGAVADDALSPTLPVVFPNPSVSSFNIKNPGNENDFFTLSVFDMTGKMMEEHYTNDNIFEFGNHLGKGMYIVRIANASENKSMRIVKTQ